jgi:GT2 family glycosyltransferase
MYAPVVLFTYKRPIHTKMVLDALSNCDWIQETDVIIYVDGLKQTATQEDKDKIEQTRQVLLEYKKSHNFKSLEVHLSDENRGIAYSVKKGAAKELEKYGKIIIMEDDIVPQKGFVKYMNEALDKYENEDTVWGISASAFPLYNENAVKTETFFLPVNSSWGWATWKRTWNKIDFDIEHIFEKFNQNSITQKEYNFGSYYYYQILEAQKDKKIDSWATFFMATMFLEKGWFLFPKKSLVQNTGFDATGTHCTKEDLFFNTAVTDFVEVSTIPLLIENEGKKQTERAFQKQFGKPSIFKRIQNKLNPNSPHFILK